MAAVYRAPAQNSQNVGLREFSTASNAFKASRSTITIPKITNRADSDESIVEDIGKIWREYYWAQ